MAIRRSASSRSKTERGKGRHPLLKLGSPHLSIYNYVKANPDCTTLQILKSCLVNHQRISEMVDEGLLRVVGKQGRFRMFVVEEKNVEGIGRDIVPVEMSVYRERDNTYTVHAKVVGNPYGYNANNRPTKVLTKKYAFRVPRVEESPAMQDGLIIDAEYTIIDV